jgi:ankyrin repeat protein
MYLVHAYPAAVRARDQFGKTPLHCAFSFVHEDPEELVIPFFDQFPGALTAVDAFGSTCFHLTCGRGASPLHDTINWMIARAPILTTMVTLLLKTPLHIACANSLNDTSLATIRKLMQLHPGALRMMDRPHGDTPFHCLTRYKFHDDILAYFIKEWPTATLLTNTEECLPLGLAERDHEDEDESLVHTQLFKATSATACALIDCVLVSGVPFTQTLIDHFRDIFNEILPPISLIQPNGMLMLRQLNPAMLDRRLLGSLLSNEEVQSLLKVGTNTNEGPAWLWLWIRNSQRLNPN